MTNYLLLLEAPIDVLGLSLRASIPLNNAGISTVGDLVKKSEGELLRIPNFGRKAFLDVREKLANGGRRLGEGA